MRWRYGRSFLTKALDGHPRAHRFSTPWLFSLLLVLGLIPLRLFLRRFVESDFLALAVSVPDDSFYYLLPAWHFSTHGYFTFDGLHKTYGFQPLYMLLLTALSAILPSIEAVFRAGLCINATLHVATGVLVGLAVNAALPGPSATVRYVASLLAGAVYFLGHNLFWANVMLKENPLAAFLYVLAILCLLRALSRPHERSIGADVWLGTLLGWLILARLLPSSVLAVGVMLVVVGAFLSRRSAIVIGAAMLVPLLIWGAYARVSFGHVLPTSMLVKGGDPDLHKRLVQAASGGKGVLSAIQHWRSLGPTEIYHSIGWYSGYVFGFLCDQDVGRLRFLIRKALFAVGVGGLAVCMAFATWWSRGRTLLVFLAVASLGGVLAIPVLLYSRNRTELSYFTWYLFDVSAIFVIACAVALGFLGQRGVACLPARWASLHPAVAAMVIGSIWMGAVVTESRWFRDVKPMTRWEYSDSNWAHVAAKTTLWFRSAVPLREGERVGALNAGLVGLLLLPETLINLDGLANDDIVDYVGHGGKLAEYISRERIRYVIDLVPPADWKSVYGLKTKAVMTEAVRHPPNCPECSGGLSAYYVLSFPEAIGNDSARTEK
jgi:hypothetical protein